MGESTRDDQTQRIENDLTKVLSAPVVKRSVRIAGHQTSVSIEEPFWELLTNHAKKTNRSINQLITEIDEMRSTNLSSAIRLYVLYYLQKTNH